MAVIREVVSMSRESVSSATVRPSRSRSSQLVTTALRPARAPVLLWVGAAAVIGVAIVETLSRAQVGAGAERALMVERGQRWQDKYRQLTRPVRHPSELASNLDHTRSMLRATYLRLAERGQPRYDTIRARPAVAQAVRALDDAAHELDQTLQYAVDEANDSTEEVLGLASLYAHAPGARVRRAVRRWARGADTARDVR
jgi:hypothetical protein